MSLRITRSETTQVMITSDRLLHVAAMIDTPLRSGDTLAKPYVWRTSHIVVIRATTNGASSIVFSFAADDPARGVVRWRNNGIRRHLLSDTDPEIVQIIEQYAPEVLNRGMEST